MKYFCPNYMTHPETTDKETFLRLMLKHRPEYAIVWDVTGDDIIYFQSRVWVVQYVAIKGDTVYYSHSRHYAKRAKVLFHLKNIVQVSSQDEWNKYLPKSEEFKPIRYWSPGLVQEPSETDLEDFLNLMLKVRPPFVVFWNVSLDDVRYMASRVYVVSYMPVIDNVIHYSYAKYYARLAQRKFNIPKRKKIDIQNPPLYNYSLS